MSKVKIRETSYDPKFMLKNEVEDARNEILNDIEPSKREKYAMNENSWLLQDKRKEYNTLSFDNENKMIPVGINSTFAVLLAEEGKYTIVEDKHLNMIKSEQFQFKYVWEDTLRRCRYVVQYEEKMNEFLVMSSADSNLKSVADEIVKNEDLIEFKKNLPNEAPEESDVVGLDDTHTKRDLNELLSSDYEIFNVKVEKSSDLYSLRFYVNYYKLAKRWKRHKLVVMSFKDTFPAFSLSENHLMVASYIKKEVVQVILYDLNFKVKEKHLCMCKGPLKCSVSDNGKMALSDTTSCILLSDNYKHIIENGFMTAIKITNDGSIYMGSYRGQIYKACNGSLQSYWEIESAFPILCIDNSGDKTIVQTINGVTMIQCKAQGKNNSVVMNVHRPTTSKVKGSFIFALDKYGRTRIISTVKRQMEILFKQPKGMTCYINAVTPWYDNGIHFNGEELAILYTNGVIGYKKLDQK